MGKKNAGMSTENKTFSTAQDLLGQAIQSLDVLLKSAKRAKATLVRAQARFADRPLESVEKLAASWQAADPAQLIQANHCVDSLQGLVGPLRANQVSQFQTELARISQDNHKTFRATPEGYTIGPFAITVDNLKLSVRVIYAKLDIAGSLPLSGEVVMKRILEQEAEIFGDVPPVKDLTTQFEQAVKVAYVRKEGRLPEGHIRVELPNLYYEMWLIRQGGGSRAVRRTAKPYSIARFIVELVTLIRSEMNGLSSRFRLETAVLENTKNIKKAFFVPSDLKVGYGEGTYYQALILSR